MKKGNRLKQKATRLFRVYSLWHETHRREFEKRYLRLLGEILRIKPDFDLLKEAGMK